MTMLSKLSSTTVAGATASHARRFDSGSCNTERQLRHWMIAGLTGSRSAHAALLRALRPVLTSFFARRIGWSAPDLEDLVQEVLVAVYERRGSYDPTRSFTPWLYAVARYKLVDHYRRMRRHDPVEGLEDILVCEGFATAVEARIDVGALLETLPPKQATAIRLTRLQDMSIADAAAVAGIGQSDIKVSSHRGIRTLSTRFAKAGPEPAHA